MGDQAVKFPAKEVLDTLLKRHSENKEKVGNINGELGERLRTQYDLNPDFTPFAWGLLSKIVYKGKTNELAAREFVRIGRAALDAAEEHLNRNGHTGDIATMAERAASPQGSKPKKGAEGAPQNPDAQTADNVVKLENGIKPLKPAKGDVKVKADKAEKTSKAKAPKNATTDEPQKGSFVAEQAAENARGDEHIKALAKGEEPPAKTGTMPDLPPSLDRRKDRAEQPAEQPTKGEAGRYRMIS